MPKDVVGNVSLFTEKAKAVSVDVVEFATLEQAVDYAVSVCEQKEFCQLLLSPPEKGSFEPPRATVKSLAIPGLEPTMATMVSAKAKEKGIEIINTEMRGHMNGIDMAIIFPEFAIAETGSCVLSTSNEDVQIASMVCENIFFILPKSKIFAVLEDTAEDMQKLTSKETAYTTFITGSSRTSDIERVLTLGVHGPLAMHVALLEA